MNKTGYVISMNPAKITHGKSAVLTDQVRVIVGSLWDGGPQSPYDLNLSRRWNDHLFAHMGKNLIKQKDNWGPKSFCQIKGIYCHMESLLRVRCRKGND